MNPELCELLARGGITSCFLTDENGNPVDPFSPGSIICEEVKLLNGRENVSVTLANGQEVLLQKVIIRKTGFLVVEVTNGTDTCISEPISFCRIENVLLCAPEGTEISCKVSNFRCSACVNCQRGFYESLEIFLDICQDIQVVGDVTLELSGEFCEPRDLIEFSSCPKNIALPPQCDLGFGSQQSLEVTPIVSIREENSDRRFSTSEVENVCISTEKVYDWIVQQNNLEIRKNAEDAPFICPEICRIELFVAASIDCSGFVSGNIICGNEPIEGVEVTLTADPDIVEFNPNPATTGGAGEFFSGISVPNGTPPTDVEITASATIDGQFISETVITNVSCEQDCELTLNVPNEITCEGDITGSIFCNDLPIEDAEITFSIFPNIGTFTPNPAISAADGTFTTTLTIPEGTPPTSVIITATTTVDSSTVTTMVGTIVDCPGVECPCKFRIGVEGGAAPAEVEITENGSGETLNGTINIEAVQCFTASPMCNPAVDNFNVTFGSNGTTINFIQGRRIEIECEGDSFARVLGTARAQGNVFSGIFEVEITLSIDAMNVGTWTVFATNFAGDTFSTTFMAEVNPMTFIGDCEDTPNQ